MLMQETKTISTGNQVPQDVLPGQGLMTLLALVGTKKMDAGALRARTRLTPNAFEKLLSWLQQEYLVDIISYLDGDLVGEKVQLTEKGEAALIGMLEKTCELPDLR
jgi:hypothetical protein